MIKILATAAVLLGIASKAMATEVPFLDTPEQIPDLSCEELVRAAANYLPIIKKVPRLEELRKAIGSSSLCGRRTRPIFEENLDTVAAFRKLTLEQALSSKAVILSSTAMCRNTRNAFSEYTTFQWRYDLKLAHETIRPLAIQVHVLALKELEWVAHAFKKGEKVEEQHFHNFCSMFRRYLLLETGLLIENGRPVTAKVADGPQAQR